MGTPLKLNSLKAVETKEQEGAWVTITHPAGGPLFLGGQKEVPFSVKIVGSYSTTAREQRKKNREEARSRRSKLDIDEVEDKELSALVDCTLEWKGAFDDDGAVIPFTRENVAAVYTSAEFIKDQVDAEGGNHARFFGAK